MIKEIREIAELQPQYSSENTPEMERRGIIIRSELPDALKSHWSEYTKAIPRYSKDLNIEGSDGIGRKTQAPWVRIHSKELSPSATTGFYLVIHFSTNGKYFFITLGCGASKWDSDKGDLVKYSDAEISQKVNWALGVLKKENLDYSNLNDQIDIGSPHSLPKSFEKATIICKTYDVSTATENEVSTSIVDALSLLSAIYDYCSELNDLPQSDIVKSDLESTVNPVKKNLNSRQGYGLSAAERKAVELRAMEVTRKHLAELGFKIKDTSANNPFDYLAERGDEIIKVEVKGTTSGLVDSIMMTSNEVELHKNEAGTTALAIVSEIEFDQRGDSAKCTGGSLEYIYPWDIEEWSLEPKAYLVIKP
jgi:hypothetical protein